jgi:hypothetical protein
LPESAEAVGRELPFLGQSLEGITLEDVVVVQVRVEHLALEDEEPAVNPLLHGRLLAEGDRAVFGVEHDDAERRARPYAREGGQAAFLLVEGEQLTQVEARQPVAIGGEHHRFRDVHRRPLEAPAGVGLETGLGERDRPAVAPVAVDDGLVAATWPAGLPPPAEVLPDQLALVAEAKDEPVEPVVSVRLHDVPEDRVAADLDEPLRDGLAVLAEPRTLAAAQDHDRKFHRTCRLPITPDACS